jgi:ABC-type antimicrobial peptide transport system permease subunit
MNRILLILRNLWFHRKPYLTIAAGVVVSTAVITGALITGDSVRFSLQRLTELRLGKIEYALQTNERFFRQELADEMSPQMKTPVVPALQAAGIAINSDLNLRINQVQILGIDGRFSQFCDHPFPEPETDEVVISLNVAEKLKLKQGDDLLLRIRNQGKAPSSAPFVSEKEPSVSIRLKVSFVAGDEQMGRFSLKNNQTAPFNVFLSLKQMSSMLELPGTANLLLTAGNGKSGLTPAMLDSTLWNCWEPADAGLQINPIGNHTLDETIINSQITTDRIFFDDSTSDAVLKVIPGCKAMLTYLVNSIALGDRSTPYSFVTAANETFTGQTIGPREIIISDWLAKDLDAGAGDSVMLRYFLMGPLRSLREDSTLFVVKSIFPMNSGMADPSLMPDFPGMSDAGNCRDWETGAPVNLKKIRDKDELYWKDYRGTPKAFISLTTGQQIWGNRFGNYTSFRFDAMGTDLPEIKKSLMLRSNPANSGLFFRPVLRDGQVAAQNSTDFGELFLSLSFFILASGLLLTALLFSLLARTRAAETGILSAVGFRKSSIMGILASEAFLVSSAGAIVGAGAGILYTWFIVLGLNTIWVDAVNTSLLVMEVKPGTLLTGVAAGVITSMLVLLFILWKNLRNPLSQLVKGVEATRSATHTKTGKTIYAITAISCLGISMAIIISGLIQEKTQIASLKLIAGGFILIGGMALLRLFLMKNTHSFALKNLSCRPGRTLTAVALLSLGTFTIFITGANRKSFYGLETSRQSGTGGFLLWATTSLPVMDDLNSAEGAGKYGLTDETLLQNVRYIQLRQLDGDDASCLNLNQVSKPGIVGIPAKEFDRLGAFSFTALVPAVDISHPWTALSKRLAPDVIPGFADQTVITWGLQKSVGDTLLFRDESGKILKIKLMGGLDNSIFQGSLLISDSLLQVFYPSSGGSGIMLIDGPLAQMEPIARKLESLFRDLGMMTTTTSERLASFNAVENTYLSVFMMLGGLGIIIGTIGLGIVLMQNMSQRTQELALYHALGFRNQFVFKLILTEHLLILLSGLMLGLLAALPVILPLLISQVHPVPWLLMSGILVIVLANGFLWIYFPARRIISGNPVSGLREE